MPLILGQRPHNVARQRIGHPDVLANAYGTLPAGYHIETVVGADIERAVDAAKRFDGIGMQLRHLLERMTVVKIQSAFGANPATSALGMRHRIDQRLAGQLTHPDGADAAMTDDEQPMERTHKQSMRRIEQRIDLRQPSGHDLRLTRLKVIEIDTVGAAYHNL